MAEEVRKYLFDLLFKVDGLYCILITDRDGVAVIKVATEKTPEMAMRQPFLSAFSMATDQGSKFGLGKNKSIICMYGNYQVVQINDLPLVITFIGSQDCNTGHVMALKEQISPLLQELKKSVVES
ncbi:unnamed protein product [Bemisia tabaci]|uniref:Uncharacterized protein n=1 Tax=Bemisia tabaci TaxID=7038 RepID=A0A9P0C8D2_BEMTA|nr:PREDICTED: ragulator complex protein LAMTOR3-A [Bemisia tabaci]CAH0769280.1 unnamed protein product [Bemisia tabaci]